MKFFILLSVVAAAIAARLDNAIYLPPNAGSSAGHNAGLEPPHSADQHQHSQNLQQGGGGNTAEILKYDNEITDEGYHYAYETSDGTKAEQQGRVIPGAQPEEGSLQVSGSYSYIGDDGQTYSVSYTADENGFHAEGAHLPTPPPIPAEILESLKLTDRRSEDQYSSSKSSYDADAGY